VSLPEASLPQHVSVIAAEDDNSIVVQLALLQNIQEFADAVIDIADGAVVGSACPLDLVVAKLFVPQVTNLEKALAVWVLVFLWDPYLGKADINALIQIPVLLLNTVGIVGVCERNLARVACPVSMRFTGFDDIPKRLADTVLVIFKPP
jgi:hypothetical protein